MEMLRGVPMALLLAPLLGLVVGEAGSFGPCLRFFHRDAPPTGFAAGGRYTPVCQRFHNQYRFATLYDRQGRAPLYSAYRLTPAAGKRPKAFWKYEPQWKFVYHQWNTYSSVGIPGLTHLWPSLALQLAFPRDDPEMRKFPKRSEVSPEVIESQAVLLDYINSTFTKGHLNPSLHHHDTDDRRATFTLTNTVPQKMGSNDGPWAWLEAEVRGRLETRCLGPAHVITGALPYASGARWIRNRVAVPEYMWSAYCCPSYNASGVAPSDALFPSYAAVGRNDRNSSQEIVPVDPKAGSRVRGYDVRPMPLAELEEVLRRRLALPIALFQGQCG